MHTYEPTQVAEAKQQGARVLLGGAATTAASGRGRFFQPTIIGDATPAMSVMALENFGPILTIAPVDDDAHAVQVQYSCCLPFSPLPHPNNLLRLSSRWK